MCCHSPPSSSFLIFVSLVVFFFFAWYAFVCAQHVKAVSLRSPLSLFFFIFVSVEEEKNELCVYIYVCIYPRCKKEQLKPHKDEEGKRKSNIEYGFVCECAVCADSHDSLLDEQHAVLFFFFGGK